MSMTEEEMVAALSARGYRIRTPVDQATCKHIKRQGVGSGGSDGSSSFTGHCSDCGKDLSYKIEASNPLGATLDMSMQPRN